MASFPPRLALLLVPGLLWLWVIWNLHLEWTVNAQYNYGWAVPLLAALLFYQRWERRPTPSPAISATTGHLLLSALLILLLPVRLIEEANPDWRLLSWVLALLVASYSLVVMAMTGGGSWTRHFAFPVLFPLVAVPWPVQVENVVTQSLAHGVATAAVEIAGWIGVAAFQLGSVIQLHNGFVGVDDACSGVKTLQAGIMVALFLGEVRSLTALQRVLLLIGGCSWVFLCNVARATTLVGIAAQRGFDALHAAHDLVGTIVLIAGMGGLVGLAWLFRSRKSEEEARTPSRSLADGCQARLVGTAAAVTWLIAIFVFTEFWYRPNERQLLLRPVWSVEWPEDAPGFAEQPIADATRAILRYSSATSAAWLSDRGGERWWGFFARWEPQRTAQGMARSHSPEICLPATGRTFRGTRAPFVVQTAAGELPFSVYEFEQEQQPLFVFVCIQEDKVSPYDGAAAFEWNARGRLRAAWNGQRNLGQRLLELALIGSGEYAQAEGAARETVRQIVRGFPKG
ncbi:MAG: exosortase/archaeosortase family protein [Chthoniobacterales bacterium]|nr:exosortase/archaeosortase family protein [Chthoniobacterales bacterium]